MASLEQLERISQQTGFQGAAIERVLRLIEVLGAIMGDRYLKTRFALKGGTALNLFYLDLDRLSVDIDLNYIGAIDLETMRAEKDEIEKRLPALLTRLGYHPRREPSEHAGGKWIFRYTSAEGVNGTLEVDTNYLYRSPFFGTHILDSAPLGEIRAEQIRVIDLNEVAGGKLVALMARRAARDLYDAWRIVEHPGLDWTKVKAATLAIGAAGRDLDWRDASLDGYTFDVAEIRTKLFHVARADAFGDHRKDPKAWGEHVLAACKPRLSQIFDFTSGERAFLDALYEEGRIDVSGLDADDDVKARIETFPALRWKAQNVKAYRASTSGRSPR